jgi:acetoacetyl-CoA reductase/3-oxoacyl-[acyl-carrier protein] reductase
MAGLTGRAGQANYSAAKAGTVGFMKSLGLEVGRWGITANVICPGFIDSKLTRAAPAEVWERARTDSACGTLSSVEVVASFTTWLLSDLCHGVTAQVFNLDSRIL